MSATPVLHEVAEYCEQECEPARADVPVASIVVANYNGAPFLDDCLSSALRQSVRRLEVIVIDDGSTDSSVALIRRWAERDARLVLIETGGRLGPGAARNLGLDAARGEWIAILDSDDVMHPRRLADLIAHAERCGAAIVADNQIVFDNEGRQPPRPLLTAREVGRREVVSVRDYVDSNRLYARATPLGYLKPVFSRALLDRTGCRYDPALRIAEDYDLVLRLLLSGATMHLSPQLSYFYRRHSGSISHRLSKATLLPMMTADDAVRTLLPRSSADPLVVAALDRRRRSIGTALQFDDLVERLRARRWRDALSLCLERPAVARLLAIPARDKLLRFARGRTAPRPADARGRRVTVLSRQRIVGATNGSSAYLLSLCGSLRQAGFDIDLVSPSPAMFGRQPFLRLKPEMSVFSSHRIRGAWRFGDLVVARDPRIALRAVAGLAGRWLGRADLDRKAPHAVGVPLSDADRLFIAGHTRRSDLLLIDYAFLTDAIPFAVQPSAASAVVMHDLFSAPDAKSVLRLDRDDEMALLARADAVITIQAAETEIVRRLLPPETRVILAPMAVATVAAAQPGRSDTVLFVGSNTVPNIDAIRWFVRESWPDIARLRPQARLWVAGGCCVGVTDPPAGVDLLGRVDELGPLYADAGVVISPLRQGSGLKIKLVEALGQGKAVVASPTTLQGVEDIVSGAVLEADGAAEFIHAVSSIIADRPARQILGESALLIARRHFSAKSCYGELLDYADGVARTGRQERGDHAAHR